MVEDIEARSGARVNISKPAANKDDEDPAGRLVVITGLPHAVQAAHRFVLMRLEAFEAQNGNGLAARPGSSKEFA